nr:hypothetical protein [uncultured Carboxylicivirga sp.]
MTRRLKIFAWIGTVILISIGIICFILYRNYRDILFAEPRNPKIEIKETYQIGWWSYQESLRIDSFKVELVESKLNLFNNKSLVKYTVKGIISHEGHWKPFIENVHVSQRLIRKYNRELHPYLDTDTVQIPEAIIEITPIIKVTNDKTYNGEELKFEFSNEIKLESFHWGNNWVRFLCNGINQDLILQQRK